GDAALVDRYVEAGCAGAEQEGERDQPGAPDPSLEAERSLYLRAILDGNRDAALGVALETLRKGFTVPDLYCDLLQPCQVEVGRLWERNEIGVAREHMATAITQFVVGQLYPRLERSGRARGNAVVTGVEGELHQLGGNMVADVLESGGWNVRFLGTSAPHRDVLRTLE